MKGRLLEGLIAVGEDSRSVRLSIMGVILETSRLTMDFRGFRALDDVSLRVQEGTIHAIIGPNGAGKTTLFNLLSGLLQPTTGHVLFEDQDITRQPPHRIARQGIARSFQISSVFPHLPVMDGIRLALQARRSGSFAFWLPDRIMQRFDLDAIEILASVGLAEFAYRPTRELPYGLKRAVEIGLTLALRPKLLLLDEPTAGLTLEEAARIVDLVRRIAQDRTIVLVEHNMGVVAALSKWITVLQRGRILAEGTYADLRANPQVIEAYLGGVA